MSEIDVLYKWLEDIARLKQWPPANEWSNQEYSELSEEISEKSGILLNRNTLRKLVTHLSEGMEYMPRIATRNAFAIYLGFDSWKMYVNSVTANPSQSKQNYLLWISVLVVIGIVAVLGGLMFKNKTNKVQFEIVNPVGMVPHTIECDYNLTNIKSDNIKIDFGHVDPIGKYLLVDLNKNRTIRKECFHYPGGFQIRLFIDEKERFSKDVWINSNDWFAYIIEIMPNSQVSELPDWFVNKGLPPMGWIQFDAIVKPQSTPDGFMHIPSDELKRLDHLTTNYHTHFKNYRDFGVTLNNCHFKISFKDEDFGTGTYCHELALHLHGEKGKIGFKFAEEGCNRYTHQLIGKDYISGIDHNLDYLIISYKTLTSVEIHSGLNDIQLFVDGLLRNKIPVNQDFGKLRGLHFWFKGSPYIDLVEITDTTGAKVLLNDFSE